jgi:DAK2 domain fusion protein YloV
VTIDTPSDTSASHSGASDRHEASPGPANDAIVDGIRLLSLLRAAGQWLERHVDRINALNVFPVPDGDTGTNMSLTMRAALDEVHGTRHESVSEMARVVAHGALMGARGNSGVILSQILRGIARALDDKGTIGAGEWAAALQEGAATAYKGVVKPVEGTILTVARESADAAKRAAEQGGNLEHILSSAVEEAKGSLARTPTLLPVLAEAGVVDAGGQGYTVLLEGMLRSLRSETLDLASPLVGAMEYAEMAEGVYNYDTQFVIQGSRLDVESIREVISSMGDSVLVVGDEEAIKVHVHSDHPGQVLDYGISIGQVTAVVVENMQLQYEEFQLARAASATSVPTIRPTTPAKYSIPTGVALVAVVSGAGLQRVFESLGVSAIVPGGQTMNPSTQDLLRAIDSVPSDKVVILPNNSNIILTAQQAKELSNKEVVVVPTKTIPQGIAALLAFNYQADLPANAELMTQTSQQVQTGEITRAVRTVQVNGLSIQEGQIIGLLNDMLVTAGEDTFAVATALLQLMEPENCEIVTIYYGQDVSATEAAHLADDVRSTYGHLEVEVLDGGQPHYYYIISAE